MNDAVMTVFQISDRVCAVLFRLCNECCIDKAGIFLPRMASLGRIGPSQPDLAGQLFKTIVAFFDGASSELLSKRKAFAV